MQNKIFILISFVCLTLIAGCAGSPYKIKHSTLAELESVSTRKLIRAYNNTTADTPFSKYEKTRTPEMTAELKRRKLVPESDWEFIENNKIGIGMTETGLYISWGYPRKVNESGGSYGTHKQLIYDRGKHSRQYVYTENGIVTSWQNR